MNDFWEYNPSTNKWTQKPDFPGEPRVSSLAFTVGNKGYVFAGEAYFKTLHDVWEFDPSADSWTKKSDLKEEGGTGFHSCFIIDNIAYLPHAAIGYLPTMHICVLVPACAKEQKRK